MKTTALTSLFAMTLQLTLMTMISNLAQAYKEPNGNSVGFDVYCPTSSKSNDLIGCYSSAVLTTNVYSFQTGKLEKTVKSQLITRIEENDQSNDSLGVGYCTSEAHPFHVNQDIIIDNKVLYPFPDFYISNVKIGVLQKAYEWDSEMAECVSHFNIIRNSADEFTIVSKNGKPVDFENIVYRVQNPGKISYEKIK